MVSDGHVVDVDVAGEEDAAADSSSLSQSCSSN